MGTGSTVRRAHSPASSDAPEGGLSSACLLPEDFLRRTEHLASKTLLASSCPDSREAAGLSPGH